MELTRTIRLHLHPTPEQASSLDETLTANRKALNYASQVAFEGDGSLTAYDLHHRVYSLLREEFGLRSQMACNVCSVVAGVYQSMRSNGNKDTRAHFAQPKLVYSWNRDYSLKENGVSLSTLEGRTVVPYLVQPPYAHYLQEGWTFGAATLVKKKKGWFLHVSVSKAVSEPDACDAVIGIDQGMRFLVTASCGGQSLFVRGKRFKQVRLQYVRLRQDLQRKGTRSAKRRLIAIGQRESRFMTDVNHQIAKEVIRFAKAQDDHPVIALEDLTGINISVRVHLKDRVWRMGWAFRQLADFIRYKAEEAGIAVVFVDEKDTSIECPRCHHVEKANRSRKHHRLLCKRCVFQLNDDLAASRTIAYRGLKSFRQSQSA